MHTLVQWPAGLDPAWARSHLPPRPIIKCFHPNLHGHAGVLNVGKLTKNRRFTPFQLPVDTFCFCVTNFQNFQSTRKEAHCRIIFPRNECRLRPFPLKTKARCLWVWTCFWSEWERSFINLAHESDFRSTSKVFCLICSNLSEPGISLSCSKPIMLLGVGICRDCVCLDCKQPDQLTHNKR